MGFWLGAFLFIIMFIFSNSFIEAKLKTATNKLDEIENEVHDKSTEIEKNVRYGKIINNIQFITLQN